MAGTAEVSASLSSCSSTSDNSIDKKNSLFTNTKFAQTTDVELGNKPVSETYSSHQQRLRRVIEDNLFLRNILLMLSNHENLLVQGRSKLYYSDKDPYYALTGSDYYIYTLRRILIQPTFLLIDFPLFLLIVLKRLKAGDLQCTYMLVKVARMITPCRFVSGKSYPYALFSKLYLNTNN